MRTLRRIVIVGNGIAGATAAETLRTAGHDGTLTIVGDEPHPAYSRPALSKSLLRDDLTSYELPPATHEATELLGVRATRLDVERRLVALDDGEQLPYDGLVVASGCRSRRLDGSEDALSLRSLDDALALRQRIASQPSVLVVGGGPLGMELASSCLTAGCETTLVSLRPPLIDQLGPYLSEVFISAALAQGLRILSAEAPRPSADLVVTAVGDLPNVEWLDSSGLLRDGAVIVDSRGRLRPEVVAAGDVAAYPSAHGPRRTPLWTSSIEQSKVAATALVRGDEAPAYLPRPYFWTEQFGLSLKAVGHLPLPGAPTVLEGDPGQPGGPTLLRWEQAGSLAAASINYRIPIPRLRRLCEAVA